MAYFCLCCQNLLYLRHATCLCRLAFDCCKCKAVLFERSCRMNTNGCFWECFLIRYYCKTLLKLIVYG